MDINKALVSALLAGGKPAFKYAIERGLNDTMLEGEGKTAFLYVLDHLKEYPNHFPSTEIVSGKTGIELPPSEGSFEFFVDEILSIRLHKILHTGIQGALEELEKRKPQEATDLLTKLLVDIRNEKLGSTPAVSLFSLGGRVLEIYEMMKAGKRGIPLPFPSLNETTLGVWPQDLILFVARLGVGKTWTLLQCAKSAWSAGYKVLVATTEMSQERMAQRFLAMELQLQYGHFRRGKLDAFTEKKMYERVTDLMLKDEGRLHVIGGDFDFRVENLAAEVENIRPDLLIVDGAYLLQTEGHNRTEKAANAFNDLKRLANRTLTPVVVSSQFNRDVDKNNAKSADVANIGLTDVAGWNADVIYGLVQSDEMAQDRRMIFKPLKVREGKGEEFECIWDIDNMEFKELPKGPEVGGAITEEPFGVPGGSTPSSDGHDF